MISITDRILKANNEGSKYCLMMVDFNKFNSEKYFAKEDDYVSNEVVDFVTTKTQSLNILPIKLSYDEVLQACNLFVSKFMRIGKVTFVCMKKHRHNKDVMSSYKKCRKTNMTLEDIYEEAFDMIDWSQMQHFQFSLTSGKYELCGFVHGYHALGDLTKGIALNLGNRKIKIKTKGSIF